MWNRGIWEISQEGNPWRPISRRELFFGDAVRWLCLTADAGVGKTTTLKWVEQETDRVDLWQSAGDIIWELNSCRHRGGTTWNRQPTAPRACWPKL